jgi:hypothetical protein
MDECVAAESQAPTLSYARSFALIALLRPHVLDRQAALIEYNVAQFRTSLAKITGLEAGR